MDRRIKELYNDEILKEASVRFGVDESTISKLGGFESFIYMYKKGNAERILRIAHSYHRSLDDLNAEMEWLNFLTENGGDVAGAVFSKSMQLVEKINIGDTYFLASSIEKAPGEPPSKDVWKAPLFKEWGRAVGRLHRLTKDYVPLGKPRFQWDEEYLVDDFTNYLPDEQWKIKEKGGHIIDTIKSLPKSNDSYGLIHTDVHQGNFFHYNGKITIFDFDDCAYKHFISDIAIAVFYSMMSKGDFDTKEEFAKYFLHNFMIGYNMENSLDYKWFSYLGNFLKLRELTLYVAIYRSINLDEPDEWCLNYLKEHRPTIENDVPVLFCNII